MNADISRWAQIIEQFQPQYYEWKIELEQGRKVHADLSRHNGHWCITLDEKSLSPDTPNPLWTDPGVLDERVNWALSRLESWAGVRRMSFNMWYFKTKRDAEKFQTLYNLVWASE